MQKEADACKQKATACFKANKSDIASTPYYTPSTL